jgi:hypothetical protein
MRNFINFVDEDKCTCDVCDKKTKGTVHFDLLKTAYVLCPTCIEFLYNAGKKYKPHSCNQIKNV